MKQQRNQLLDVTKGVAIILVVLAHSIQQCSGIDGSLALNLWIQRFMISFYMPLFMLVSGYLFFFSLQRHTEKDIVKGRLQMFAWPILTMGVLHHLRGHITHFDTGAFLTDFPSSLFNSLWFFWALLIITILVCIVHKYLSDHWMGYLAIIVFTLLLPDGYPLRAYVHLLPMFAVAYLFAKYKYTNKRIGGGLNTHVCMLLLIVLVVTHALMLQFFGQDDMIYFSRYSLLGSSEICTDMAHDGFRFIIGIVGSLVILLALHMLIKSNILKGQALELLNSIGSMTFGIYVFQDLMLLTFSPLSKYLNGDYYVLNSAIAFVVIFVLSVVMTRIAEKDKWMSLLFLGKVTG